MLVGHLASTKEDTGNAQEDPHIMGTARTGVGTTTRKVRDKDRTLQGIKEYLQELPKTERLRMWVMSRTDQFKTSVVTVPMNHPNLTQHPVQMPSKIQQLLRNLPTHDRL